MRGRRLQDRGEALAVRVQRPPDERRLGAQGQGDRVEGVVHRAHRGRLGDLSFLGRGGVLPLGQPVDPVVEQQDLEVDVAPQRVDQVVPADRERVAVPGDHPYRQVRPRDGQPRRDRGGAAVDRVHPVGVEVVREPRAAPDAGDEHGVLAPDPERRQERADGRQHGVVTAAGAPADLLVAGEVLRGLLRVGRGDAVQAADRREPQIGEAGLEGRHACTPVALFWARWSRKTFCSSSARNGRPATFV